MTGAQDPLNSSHKFNRFGALSPSTVTSAMGYDPLAIKRVSFRGPVFHLSDTRLRR
jgi:hypothetical protein